MLIPPCYWIRLENSTPVFKCHLRAIKIPLKSAEKRLKTRRSHCIGHLSTLSTNACFSARGVAFAGAVYYHNG
jgi:hypothetical protein